MITTSIESRRLSCTTLVPTESTFACAWITSRLNSRLSTASRLRSKTIFGTDSDYTYCGKAKVNIYKLRSVSASKMIPVRNQLTTSAMRLMLEMEVSFGGIGVPNDKVLAVEDSRRGNSSARPSTSPLRTQFYRGADHFVTMLSKMPQCHQKSKYGI
jgi:hypothetical protein